MEENALHDIPIQGPQTTHRPLLGASGTAPSHFGSSFKDQILSFGVLFLCGSSEQDLERFPSVNGQRFRFVGKKDLSITGGLLDRGTSCFGPKRGQWEVAGEFSAPDSDGVLFEAACGCFEITAEFHVRCRKRHELRVRGRALHELW